jgi:hypothetical protein
MNILDMIGGALGGAGTGGNTNYGQLFEVVQNMGGLDARPSRRIACGPSWVTA